MFLVSEKEFVCLASRVDAFHKALVDKGARAKDALEGREPFGELGLDVGDSGSDLHREGMGQRGAEIKTSNISRGRLRTKGEDKISTGAMSKERLTFVTGHAERKLSGNCIVTT